ncbi:MAG: hypothetical protein AB1916_03130 [Thermodesulfobacteriota bacterium]
MAAATSTDRSPVRPSLLLAGVLALVLAACAAPAGWHDLALRGPGQVTAQGSAQGRELRLTVARPGFTVFTLHRPAPELAADRGRARLRFAYRATGPALPLAAWISAGPGWAIPAVRHILPLTADGQARTAEAVFDLAGLPEGATPVLQLAVVGDLPPDAALELAGLDLAPLPAPDLEARLAWPGSRTLLAGVPGQAVALDLESREGTAAFHLRMEPREHGGPTTTAEAEVSGQGRAELPLPPLPAGEYQLSAAESRGRGLWVWSLRAAPPVPAPAVLADGRLSRDGAPFFPIGIFHASDPVLERLAAEPASAGGTQAPDREAMLASLAARGFNTVHHSWTPASPEFHRAAARHGLLVVSELGGAGPEALAAQRAEPNALGWYAWDEPTADAAPRAAAAFRRLKAADPLRPVLAAADNACAGFGPHRFADLVLSDPYPVDGPRSDVSLAAESVRICRTVHLAGDPQAAVIAVPQLFTADTERWRGFAPTPDQVRAQAYAALTAGAAGVMYYAYATFEPLAAGMPANPARTHWHLPESPLWESIGALNAELAELGPLLLASWEAPAALLADGPVLTRTAALDGRLVLVFANPRAAPARLTVRRPLPGPPPAALNGAPLPVPTGESAWSADLPPYGAGTWVFPEP